jgi:hypothetical protein
MLNLQATKTKNTTYKQSGPHRHVQTHDGWYWQEENDKVHEDSKRFRNDNKKVELRETIPALHWMPKKINRMAAKNVAENGADHIDGIEEVDDDSGILDTLDRKKITIKTCQRISSS